MTRPLIIDSFAGGGGASEGVLIRWQPLVVTHPMIEERAA